MWPAVTASSLSAVFFCVAFAFAWRVDDERETGDRHYGGVAALFFGLAILLLLIAVVFWLRYLVFGPISDWVREMSSSGD